MKCTIEAADAPLLFLVTQWISRTIETHLKVFSHSDDMNSAAPADISAKPAREGGKTATRDKGREKQREKQV